AGPPPPQSLLSAAVARMVANSDAWPERRLATAIEYYLTVLSFYVRQSGGTLPPDWETYRKTLRIAPAIPVSYETVVPPQPGEMALTLEVDRSRTALRMRIAPQDAPEAWLYWRVSRHPTDGRWPLVPADECQEPDLVERTYSLLLSQVIPE
ncbi:MAG TPA: hypothetical protein VEI97_12225, partial [bacterium]|nr:hypothetical protein [bacterium]